MQLLFDQNISFRIVKLLDDFFPDSQQVRLIGMENASDFAIWDYAKNHHFTIVTFDADFADIANIKGCPPKIIWLRFGNTTTKNIARKIIEHKIILQEFLNNNDYTEIACLEIA